MVDYYKILQVDKNAKNDDLKRAYEKLAKNFELVCEAYEVLSDGYKRSIYDEYGEEALKDKVFSSFGGSSEDIFSKFFSSRCSPSDGFSPGSSNYDTFESFFGGRKKPTPIERSLPCSLEELYTGTTKKMKISRQITSWNGKNIPVEEILNIDVKPGWKKGTKITFPEKGDEGPNKIAADVVFIIDEKPHSVFVRDGDDLRVTKAISLVSALTGYTVRLTALDGRNLTIPIDRVIDSSYEEVVLGEGMPSQKDRSKKGNLKIKFIIKSPTRLTPDQKAGIQKILDSPI